MPTHTALKISRQEGFSRLLKTRPVSKTPRLFLHVLNSATPLACGALVPKRFAKRAVDRNALKRMFREACRHQTVFTQGRLLIRLVKPAGPIHTHNRADWWNEIEQLFNVQSKA